MKASYKRCQSCGMPLNKDRNGGGTEPDGSRSLRYCSYCYDNGNFRKPTLTAHQMQETVKQVFRKQGQPWFVAAFWAWRVPRLERWRKS
ncbi:MAG: zinc ribbon domain-containing protein [Gammaproteobacteria bacterium]|jgi:hypothetical protein